MYACKVQLFALLAVNLHVLHIKFLKTVKNTHLQKCGERCKEDKTWLDLRITTKRHCSCIDEEVFLQKRDGDSEA